MAADAADIRTGLKDSASSHSKYKGKKTQLATKLFDELVSDLNVWLETKDKSTVDSAEDKKLVARVIAHDASLATSYIAAPNGDIGPYPGASLPSLVTATATRPTHTNLMESFSYKEWPDVRAEVARVLGIKDKGHSTHGSNFKGDQTLRQVIKNLVETVKGDAEILRIQNLLRQHYPGY